MEIRILTTVFFAATALFAAPAAAATCEELSRLSLPQWKMTWTGGEQTILLKEIRANAPIEDARLARPVPAR